MSCDDDKVWSIHVPLHVAALCHELLACTTNSTPTTCEKVRFEEGTLMIYKQFHARAQVLLPILNSNKELLLESLI